MTYETAKQIVTDLAARAASDFASEFPGEHISGDWDSEAHSIDFDPGTDETNAAVAVLGHDAAWDLYREHLHASVELYVKEHEDEATLLLLAATAVALNIHAEITGRGENSTVPDNKGAVDAAIYAGDSYSYIAGDLYIGSVTLLPNPGLGNRLTTWGPCMDMWADASVLKWLQGFDDEKRHHTIELIEEAVNEAA